ncbi:MULTISPECIES: hypothetical protein [unclassified Isoptericola]|uniref:hypothetical protein n=1 Tax=unclassified Isoptericola TaxID=2623355 RepID=UPI00365C189E
MVVSPAPARRRAAPWAALALVGATGLAACSSAGVDCPAVGYFDTLEVALDGDLTQVDLVQVCTDTWCSPGPGVDESSSPTGTVTAADDDHTWSFALTGTPDEVVVRVLADEAILAKESAEPRWHEVSPGPCPGPSEATVAITVPATA